MATLTRWLIVRWLKESTGKVKTIKTTQKMLFTLETKAKVKQ